VCPTSKIERDIKHSIKDKSGSLVCAEHFAGVELADQMLLWEV
jgi:hypothetical protein